MSLFRFRPAGDQGQAIDYYQPEVYLPASDTYIEKDSASNESIDTLCHSASKSLFTRRDVLDIFPVYEEVQVEFFGEEIESLALIDPLRETQRQRKIQEDFNKNIWHCATKPSIRNQGCRGPGSQTFGLGG